MNFTRTAMYDTFVDMIILLRLYSMFHNGYDCIKSLKPYMHTLIKVKGVEIFWLPHDVIFGSFFK